MDSDESTSQGEISFSELEVSGRELRALANPLARHTVRFIDAHPKATLDEVADAVAGFEAADTDAIVTASTRDRFQIKLYHVVLPRLDDVGLVQFDRTARTVERADIPDGVAALLELGD